MAEVDGVSLSCLMLSLNRLGAWLLAQVKAFFVEGKCRGSHG